MHATIIGVAAPANPPPPAVAPPPPVEEPALAAETTITLAAETTLEKVKTRANVMPAVRRNPKQTMIGGLEAVPGNAPSPQAVGLGIPTETKWTVLLANSGAEVMSAPDIVRAFVEGKISRDAKLWREGLDGWKSLVDIEPIRLAFQRAGLTLHAPETAPVAIQRPPAEPKNDAHDRSTTAEQAPPSWRTAAPTQPNDSEWADEAKTVAKQDEITRAAESPHAEPIPPKNRPTPLATTSFPPLKGGTLKPSALSNTPSKPPLEHPASRPDIGPRDTIRGQLHGIPSVPAPGPGVPLRVTETQLEPETATTQPLVEPDANLDQSATSQSRTTTRPKARRRKHRAFVWLLWLLVVVGLGTLLTLSYRHHQPKAVYSYLHQKRWDAPLDRQVQRWVVRPYHYVVKRAEPYLRKVKKR
jgi:hypothetical protein